MNVPSPRSATATAPRALVRFPALVGYVFRACVPARRLAVLLLPCAAIVLSGLLSTAVVENDRGQSFADVVLVIVFGLAMPLGTLVVGDAVLGAEVRSGTLGFTWLAPAPFHEIAVARWFGGWVVCLLTLVPCSAAAALVAGVPDHVGPMVIATAAGSAAHVALFVAVGCITRRAAVWSVAIVFLVERLLGAVLSAIAQLSPSWLSRSVYVAFADLPSSFDRSGIPEGGAAVVRLALVTVVLLAVATWGLRRLQLTGSRD